MSLPIHVDAYSGFKANERPSRFVLNEHLGPTALWAIEGPLFCNVERTVHQELGMFCEGIQRS